MFVAGDGRQVFDTAFRECPDVIVSDVNMPGMGGVEMVKALRRDPRTAGVRVLMLTSETSVETRAEGLAAGADDYILAGRTPTSRRAVRALLARSRPAAVNAPARVNADAEHESHALLLYGKGPLHGD